MVKIDQSSGTLVTIDQSNTALYSDMIIQSTTLTPLKQNSNYRFYFDVVSSLSTIYYASFSISHTYPSFGSYNMTLSSSKLGTSLTTSVIVNGCKII